MPGFSVKLKGEGTDPKYCCSSCALLLNEPRQTSCGHRYCRSCLEDLNRTGGGNCMCKVLLCGEQIKVEEVFPDKAIEKEMRRIEVVCKHGDHGCKWEGLLMDLKVHKESCRFAPAKCDWCGKEDLNLAKLQRHQNPHTGDCPNMKIPCAFAPVGCMEMIHRRCIQEHQQEFLVVHQSMLLGKVLEERQRQEPEPRPIEQRIQILETKVSQLIQTRVAADCQQNTGGLPSTFSIGVAEVPNVVAAIPATGANDNDMQRPAQQLGTAPTAGSHTTSGAPVEQETTDPEVQRGRIIELEKNVAMLESLERVLRAQLQEN